MKSYFEFRLKAEKFLPLWLIFYFVYVSVLVLKHYLLKVKGPLGETPEFTMKTFLGSISIDITLWLIVLIWSFYFIRLVLESIHFKDINFQCNYIIRHYLAVVFSGLFLSIVTLGIYLPWFYRNLHRFFINNSYWRENNFNFRGSGEQLLVIFLLTVIVPLILLFITAFSIALFLGNTVSKESFVRYIIPLIFTVFIIIPYMYHFYKWRINVTYRDYSIQWHTSFWPSIGKIALEVFLSLITIGIYFPLALVRLYEYFSERTRSNEVDGQYIKFGYDLEEWNDFRFIWGQILLIIITLGIYYPWGFCKVSQRILGKSYIHKIRV